MNATCPNCGKPVLPSALEGLCPECMLALGAATHTEAPGETGSHTKTVPAPPPAVGEIAKHFPQLELLELLGRGGMGVVYKARQPRLDRLVALKILAPEKEKDPQFAERFTREAQALARLNHPNIVAVYDFGVADGLYYLLMEYVDGTSLRARLQRRKLAPEEALAIVPGICEALQYAHQQGIVHRDIKPENLLLDKQGRLKIADFGIAKILGQATREEALTGAREVVGTPHYMAPEQVEKPQRVDHRADIYSLGVVFYEMLTGELPLGKFPPPSQKARLDTRLDGVVLHALEKEPALRYQHASEVKSDVETIAHSEAPPRLEARRRFKKLAWAAGGCALVAVLCWLFLFTGGKPNVTVTGAVTDASTGRPIAGARVADNVFGAKANRAAREAWTDANGHYALATRYEEHTLAISAAGYETRIEMLLTDALQARALDPNFQVPLDVALHPIGRSADKRTPSGPARPGAARLEAASSSADDPGVKEAEADPWQAKLLALNQADWRQAAAIGARLAALPPEQGFAALKQAWGEITNLDARQQLLKAFVFYRAPAGAPSRYHERLFDVLDLGMRDPAPGVQSWAIGYLKDLTQRDFSSDFSAYERWRQASAGQTVPETMRQSLADFLAWAPQASPAELAASFARPGGWRDLLADLDESQLAQVKELLATSAQRLQDEALAQGALRLVAQLPPDEVYLRRIVLPVFETAPSDSVQAAALECLGNPRCGWALDLLLERIKQALAKGDPASRRALWGLAAAVARIGDPRAIPFLIGAIEADNSYDTVYGLGYFGLSPLTGVTYDEAHNGAWWRSWWVSNKGRFPAAEGLDIPRLEVAGRPSGKMGSVAEADDTPDIIARELLAEGDPAKRFYLISRKDQKAAPEKGYRLLIVMPGGDGSSNFLSFVKRIHQKALKRDYLIAQLVAPQWDKQQAEQLVWPTESNPYPGMKFSTEAFVHAVIRQVEKQYRLDPRHLFTLTWSSSGPAGYATSLYPKSRITGSFVAMSVFRPDTLPDLKASAGRAYFLLHSREDFIPFQMAEQARDALRQCKAKVQLLTYAGGHGWQGDVYANLRMGIAWLEKQTAIP